MCEIVQVDAMTVEGHHLAAESAGGARGGPVGPSLRT